MRSRALAGLLAAVSVSQLGTKISAVALPWFVLVTTGSAAQTGLVAFCEMTPYVLAKALSGPLIDRAGPRVTSWTTDVVSAAAVAAIPPLHAAGLLPLWLLLLLVALVGLARGPGDLAKQVMVPEAADRDRVPLERATGLAGVAERLAGTVGPAGAGVLVAALDAMTALMVNAACFAAGSLLVAATLPRGMGRGRPATPEATEAGEVEPAGYWRRFGEGFAYLRREPLLLSISLTVAVTNLLDAAYVSVLLPVWAERSGHGPSAIGVIGGVFGGTAVCGSLLAAVIAHRLPRLPLFFGGFLLAGAPRFVVLALSVSAGAPLWSVLAVCAVGGFGSGFLNPIIGAVTLERIPRHMLGRVQALFTSLAWSGIPLGGLIGGAAVGAAGLVPVLLVTGLLYFLTTNLAALQPEWRRMDRARAAAGSDRADPADRSDSATACHGAATGSG
ncbi:MFS transporter [Streptomyces sp. 8K308]|uniref:MFS transporter n=1 Tax=Streptomyces sp. 8K308 TaxID=2530388 RepID=UPI001FB7B17F|nr:MFS transporter [Streptomyces sp. 8K308]